MISYAWQFGFIGKVAIGLSTSNVMFGLFLIKMVSASLAGVTVNDAQEEESQHWQTVQVCELEKSTQLRRNDSLKMTKYLRLMNSCSLQRWFEQVFSSSPWVLSPLKVPMLVGNRYSIHIYIYILYSMWLDTSNSEICHLVIKKTVFLW